MNQFKDYFLGNKKPEYTRVADTQKCLRVSGKHNDLEEVGVDTYHHTMFEMLGNWSFGDYFKAEAIAWSWELLTEVYRLDKSRLYVSVFEGDEKEGIPASAIALREWKKLVAEDHIVFGNKKDNFWEMGDVGPCGPCSEIHIDLRSDEERAKIPGQDLVNKDHPQVIEIWNNVFMQYNRLKDGKLQPLPAQHVDTGMGFERLVRAIQGKSSNYDTDVFSGTIDVVSELVNKKYTAGDDKESVAFRVLADHIRAIAFTIADGQLPSNTGAGYVIRRILRRAVRYYYSYLDYNQPLLYQLLPILAKQFENVFPELNAQLDFVSKVVKEEEEAFLRTLEKGLKKIDEIVNQLKSSNTTIINGKNAFELFDTYGFPIDLTRLIASENNFLVDEAGFEAEMLQQKNRSRVATAVDAEDWVTVHANELSEFVGYDSTEVKTKIVKYRKVKSKGKEGYQFVLAATPFYAESGGQVGDTGELIINNVSLNIIDTKKENNLTIHFADSLPDNISDDILAKVDGKKRAAITANHSATHLLHAALRKVLGTHVSQKGSLVNEEHLRFDFSHFTKVTDEEIAQVEAIVNEKIRENIFVQIKEMNKEEAIAMGAMALFGEKYADIVRVVVMNPHYSVELCGGTHVMSTGELGFFKIKHESAVAAGVRRIEAVSGKSAEEYIQEQLSTLQEVKNTFNNPKELLKTIDGIIAENKEQKKKIESLESKQLVIIKNELAAKVEIVNGTTFIGAVLDINNGDGLKKLSIDLKNVAEVIVLAANTNGKASVAVGLSDEVVNNKKLEAPQLIKEHITPIIKGGGGGQKTLATAGGQDASNLDLVIAAIKKLL
jgi:alanyl-tRNA synthetase